MNLSQLSKGEHFYHAFDRAKKVIVYKVIGEAEVLTGHESPTRKVLRLKDETIIDKGCGLEVIRVIRREKKEHTKDKYSQLNIL